MTIAIVVYVVARCAEEVARRALGRIVARRRVRRALDTMNTAPLLTEDGAWMTPRGRV